MCSGSNDSENDGQPVPDSNFVVERNSGSPQRRQVYTPASLLVKRPPQNGGSVP